MLEKIINLYPMQTFIIADGFNKAIIGLDDENMRLIYSVSKCLKILRKHMDEDEAKDYFYSETKYAYIGEKTPIWCEDFS
jgi:hypothetical protein